MSGMRAAEMALGEHLTYFYELAELVQADMLDYDCRGLSDAGHGITIRNVEAAREALALVLTTKLDQWNKLHWATAGLAHHDEGKANQHYNKLRHVYDQNLGAETAPCDLGVL